MYCRFHRYILPFNGGLAETGPYAPVSRYPTMTNLRGGVDPATAGGTFQTGGRTTDELAERLAELKKMQEEDVWEV